MAWRFVAFNFNPIFIEIGHKFDLIFNKIEKI
jgi:hypothetical protein